MQATGVYWFAVYDILEEHGLEVFLVNAAHTKNTPGRKTDVQESQWLMKLHRYGLLRNSFRPAEQIRKLRAVWRLRDRHVKEAGRCIQHMQKALTTMNVQLANAISDVSGTTGQAIIGAILGGERDPEKLAEFRDRRIKASHEEIVRSLEGKWQEEALFELKQAVDSYEFSQKQLRECDDKLQQYLSALPSASQRPQPEEPPKAGDPTDSQHAGGKQKRRKPTRNAPQFDLASELTRIYGVDISSVDGIDVMTMQTVLAELGTNFDAWPTEDHFASWLSLSPKRDISGGKLIRHVREPESCAG
jgi:transposase